MHGFWGGAEGLSRETFGDPENPGSGDCVAETRQPEGGGRTVAAQRVHHCLVSLVLGLNSHVYSLWVAVTPAVLPSSSRVQKESRVFDEELLVEASSLRFSSRVGHAGRAAVGHIHGRGSEA